MANELEKIPFYQTSIYAAEIDGKLCVVPRHVCQSLGLDADAQIKRLKR